MLVSNAPNQLAKQTPKENKPGGIPFDRRAINQRWDRLRIEGWKWRPAWREIRDFVAPTRGFFEYETPNWGKRIDHERIINGKASRSLNKLASGMTSGMTSSSRPWFALSTSDPDLADFEPVKEWLSMVQERMYAVLAKSNIYQTFTNLYSEIGAFGTAAQIILPDYHSVVRGRNFTAGEYFLGNGPDNRVNAFARQYWMTVGQIVEEFGLENCSQYVQTAYRQNNVDQWRLVRHLIEANDDRMEDRADFQGKKFRSVQWEEGASSQIVLRLSGFEEFPIQAPRWQITTTADCYGRGPGWEALGDTKMLQKMEKDKLKALDKVVDPPTQADGSVDMVNTLPGGLSRTSSTVKDAGVRPVYQITPDFTAITQMIQEVEKRIDESMFADLWTMISDIDKSGVTAEEIVEKKNEKMQMLGPVIEALEFELYDPAIDRIFNLMTRAGLIPPAPADLQGHELKVEYISILAQAQKMVGTTAIEQTARFAGGLIAVTPEAADLLDVDETVRKYANMTGVPPDIIRTPDKVAQIRAQRQKQQQAEAAAQAAERMTEGAKTLSETPVGNNSALDQVMAGLTGSAPQ
jgi:head-to-tail connecting protein